MVAARLALALLLAVPATAVAQTPTTVPYVNGVVIDLLVDGDTLYVGGDFTAAGAAAGPLVLARGTDGALVRSHPGFAQIGDAEAMTVDAVLDDGAGGWYAGGAFERVNGAERVALVRLRADGTVDPAFAPRLDADTTSSKVSALARHGDILWVGGLNIEGAACSELCALDARTGAELPIDPDRYNGEVTDLDLEAGRLFVASRTGASAIDAVSWRSDRVRGADPQRRPRARRARRRRLLDGRAAQRGDLRAGRRGVPRLRRRAAAGAVRGRARRAGRGRDRRRRVRRLPMQLRTEPAGVRPGDGREALDGRLRGVRPVSGGRRRAALRRRRGRRVRGVRPGDADPGVVDGAGDRCAAAGAGGRRGRHRRPRRQQRRRERGGAERPRGVRPADRRAVAVRSPAGHAERAAAQVPAGAGAGEGRRHALRGW